MPPTPSYVPPKVWQWTSESGGKFAKINRPIAGATHEKELPVGKHPLQLYSLATPNGVKVTVHAGGAARAREARAPSTTPVSINIGDGEQFGSGFVAINPNSKIPALLDRSTTPPTRVFESGAILVYLAEKFGAFLPKRSRERAPNACRGCSGRWAARRTSAAASATSTPTRRRSSSTRSTATRWK